jgi:hypothetical protein
MPLFLHRLYFLLSGNCRRYAPDATGLCRVCKIPGA